MKQLWVFYGDYYQSISLDENNFTTLTIGPAIGNDITVMSFPFYDGHFTIEQDGDGFTVHDGVDYVGRLSGKEGLSIEQEELLLHLYVLTAPASTKMYYLDYENEVSFDSQLETATFNREQGTFPQVESGQFSLNKTVVGWIIKKSYSCPLYVNGKRVELNEPLQIGDVVQWAFMEMKLIEQDILEVVSTVEYETRLSEIDVPQSELVTMYPDYRRTPRMIYDLPEDKVSLSFPTQESDDSGRGLLLIIAPPLVMLIVMGLVAILIPRGIFIIISISMISPS